jgi:RHS repeat-associated protein
MPQDYKYNGNEEQNELGLGWLDYGARMYMADIGRFMRIDSRANNYMMYSPYGYLVNNPLNNVDYNGDFVLPKEFLNRFQRIAQYLSKDIQKLLDNSTIRNALKKHSGFFDKQLKKLFTWGQGPVLNPIKFEGKKYEEFG